MPIDLNAVLPTIPGWCSVDKAQRMIDVVRQCQPDLVVEIGVFGGSSLIPLASAVKDNGKGEVVGIDPWTAQAALEGMTDNANLEWWSAVDMEQIYEQCYKHLLLHGLNGCCRLVKAKAEDVVKDFRDQSIGVLHIDGNHSEELSYKDATLWLPKVKPGGYVFFDDIWWTENQHVTTHKAVMYLFDHCDRVDIVGKDCLLLQKRSVS